MKQTVFTGKKDYKRENKEIHKRKNEEKMKKKKINGGKNKKKKQRRTKQEVRIKEGFTQKMKQK